ncbi:MAG: hypothetical protein K2L82_01370 [Lachnospiraceae bacterium]|nr:hypothetical protein [Lachnospiraceae bacterium]
MRIVILEDYPERLVGTAEQLNDICPGCEVEVLCYDPQNDYGEKAEELRTKLLCNTITIVDYWNLEEKLDELYSDPDTLFLFDTDIDRGAVIEVFEYRINVRYALKKRDDADNQLYRIWFYTTVEHLKRAIERTFGEHVIVAGQNGASLSLDLEGCPTFVEALGLHQAV